MKKGLYPGSFDPLTLGHIDIIERIYKNFDELTVLIANSNHKNYLFDLNERLELVGLCLGSLKNVKVAAWDGLTVEYAQDNNINTIIRGVRAISDFETEMAMAHMNKKLNTSIETMLVFASPDYGHLSSRLVKEVARHSRGTSGEDLKGLVPESIINRVIEKLKES